MWVREGGVGGGEGVYVRSFQDFGPLFSAFHFNSFNNPYVRLTRCSMGIFPLEPHGSSWGLMAGLFRRMAVRCIFINVSLWVCKVGIGIASLTSSIATTRTFPSLGLTPHYVGANKNGEFVQ